MFKCDKAVSIGPGSRDGKAEEDAKGFHPSGQPWF